MFRPNATVVAGAAAALGWNGQPVAIRMCGEDAWAVASLTANDEAFGDSSISLRIDGVLVTGDVQSNPTERASVFAGYCSRAVLIPDGRGVLNVQIDAAVLDQGVVVLGANGPFKLGDAGPAVGEPSELNASAQRVFADKVHSELIAAGFVPRDDR